MFIFLDIDGVMVSAKSWKPPELLSDDFPGFNPVAVQVLQKLISDETTVMITSSHKSRFNVQEWKQIFSRRGIPIKNLKTLDESASGVSRKDEILNWFNMNKISEDFVIIDDDTSLNALPDYLKENLVLTSSMIGLTESHLKVIRSIIDTRHGTSLDQ